MFDIVVRGGQVVGPDRVTPADIAISKGIIEAVAPPGEGLTARQDIDARDKLVIPGLVDAHVHIPGFLLSTHLDDFATATRAAAAGGVTTVLLMPTDDPRTASPFYFAQKKASGEGRAFVDFGLQALLGPKTEDIRDLQDLGAVSFEIFLAYGGTPQFIVGSDDYELERVMRLASDTDAIVGVTPHSPSLIARLTAEHRDDVAPTVDTRAATRTVLSETLGITRALTVGVETRTKTHVRAVSCRSSIALIDRFRDLVPLTSEVMSHHLLFDAADARTMGSYGVITPPLRQAEDRAALRQALRAEKIDMVVSDHSPCLRADKEAGRIDIWKAPPGMPGLQTLLASMLALVDEGEITMMDVVRTCCDAPARAFRLAPRKGRIAVGSDADLVIVDPHAPMIVRNEDQLSKADYTTLAGRTVGSSIARVLLRGATIFEDNVVTPKATGRFVRP